MSADNEQKISSLLRISMYVNKEIEVSNLTLNYDVIMQYALSPQPKSIVIVTIHLYINVKKLSFYNNV